MSTGNDGVVLAACLGNAGKSSQTIGNDNTPWAQVNFGSS
jgi:hypothetical protein